MTAWVETQVPCMLYCGHDICTCSARDYYLMIEEEYGDEDYWEEGKSLTADKKAQAQNRAYARYLEKLRDCHSIGYLEAGAEKSKAMCMLRDELIGSASKLNTTLTLP